MVWPIWSIISPTPQIQPLILLPIQSNLQQHVFSQITYLSGLRPDDYYNDEDIMKWISDQQELNFKLGQQYMYSNSGYWLLGQIVQKVSGMSLSDFAQQKIFTPLNMSGTRFVDNNNLLVQNRATVHFPNRSSSYQQINSMMEHTGNGGVYATVNDLKKWNNEYYKRKILKEDFWKIMTTKGVLNSGDTISYAKGLIFSKYRGLKTIDHSRRAPGYSSNIVHFPNQRFIVIRLSNTSDINASEMCHKIADIFLEGSFYKTKESNFLAFDKLAKLETEELKKFVGSYWSLKNNISRRVVLTEDTLYYERSRRRIHALLPINHFKFKMTGTPEGMDMLVHFSNKDNTTNMKFIENGKEVDKWERFQTVQYSPEELGIYKKKVGNWKQLNRCEAEHKLSLHT